MKKLTAKNLLEEVQSIKKQASSVIQKPEPIEYYDEYDPNLGVVQSQALDKMEGSWFGSFREVSSELKGDKIYVSVTGEFVLDAKKIPWYKDNNVFGPIDMYEEVASYLGATLEETGDYVVIDNGKYNVGLNLDVGGNPVAVDMRPDPYFGQPIVWDRELSGDSDEDLDLIVSKIKRHFR